MGTKANLLAGTWTIYQASTGEALPEINNLAPPTVTVTPGGTWSAHGFTVDKHELEYEQEHEEVIVNEHLGPVKCVLVKEGAILKVKFSENDLTAYSRAATATTLTTVSAAADQTAQDILKVGDGTLSEKALLCLGTSPEGGSRLIHIPFAVATGGFLLGAGKKHADSEFDVEYTVLTNPSGTVGQRMFLVYDITAAAAS